MSQSRPSEGQIERSLPVVATMDPTELPGVETPGEHFQELSAIFDSMNALVYVADMDTYELIYMNTYGRKLFGSEFRGRPCYRVLQTGQHGPCSFCTNDRLVRDGEALPPYIWEFRNTVAGRWFQCIDRAIRWTDNRLVRMEVAVDISERKRNEELLREANQTLEAMIDSSPLAILVIDPEARITRWNPAAERVFGWAEKEVLGQTNPIVPEGGWAEFRTLQERVWSGETLLGYETRRQRKDGSAVDVSISSAPLRDAGGQIVGSLAMMADISAQRRAEEFRRHYVHTISHDLRNPLMSIVGHAEMLLLPSYAEGLAKAARTSLQAIVRAANRMNVMIEDLVDSARFEGGSIELRRRQVDLEPFLDQLLEQARGALEVDRVRVERAPDVATVDADSDRLERILVNLLSNALKYSPSTTPVRLTLEHRGGDVVISVIDAGRGIDPADVPHLFERYYRTRTGRESGGVGLGLYITRVLVEAHGGRIWVESEPSAGSIFSFTLPSAAAPTAKFALTGPG